MSDAYAELGGYGGAPVDRDGAADRERKLPWRLDRPGQRPLYLASLDQARDVADHLLPECVGLCLVDEASGESWRRLAGPEAGTFHWERFA